MFNNKNGRKTIELNTFTFYGKIQLIINNNIIVMMLLANIQDSKYNSANIWELIDKIKLLTLKKGWMRYDYIFIYYWINTVF